MVLTLFPLQPNGEIFRTFEDLSHTIMHQFLLFNQFFRFWVFPELDGLDQNVLELVRQAVCGFDLDVGVANAHQICDKLSQR
jgi:hypothetical protein